MLLFTVCVVVQVSVQDKCRRFVNKNSKAISELNEVNRQFVPLPFQPLSFSETYDNEKNYENVSCRDYLIYQLNVSSVRTAIARQIQDLSQNNRRFEEYRKAWNAISSFGDFNGVSHRFNRKRISRLEKNVFLSRVVYRTDTEFYCRVELELCYMNGYVYNRKTARFQEEDVESLIRRVKNTSYDSYNDREFYNDREIWDALCRVERGKVSNKMRFLLYERDGHRCKQCGRTEDEVKLEIDHIIPISKGGKSELSNLQTLCHECNVKKGNQI